MNCPKCGAKDTRVIDSRIQKSGLAIRRRRLCPACDYRFSTTEEVVREDLYVIKSDGRREQFDRNKILNGLRRACEKRPIDLEQIEMLVADTITDLENEFDNEIPTRAIGEHLMVRLRLIDKIAYVRFASVYKEFADIEDLANEISALRQDSDR